MISKKKQKLIEDLLRIAKENSDDNETAHVLADERLLAYIGGDEIEKAFNAISKWYS